ncbi:MAG: hypothetical protein A2142_09270 [candidate division Zixibacteria bacterium RBG_16_48_11]|nr:MAG: hypothetical protein A2142_09270 [candidate division Zixibacteria bacterium RBG_16_48_11]
MIFKLSKDKNFNLRFYFTILFFLSVGLLILGESPAFAQKYPIQVWSNPKEPLAANSQVSKYPLELDPDTCLSLCGDGNGSGQVTEQDLTLLFNYLLNSAVLPASCLSNLEVDSFAQVNIRDAAWLSRELLRVTGGEPNLTCPAPFPPYQPVSKLDDTLQIPLGIILPAWATSATIPFEYKNAASIAGLALPLRIRVGGVIPQIDSVLLGPRSLTADLAAATIDPASGTINLGLLWENGLAPGKDTLLTVFLSAPPSVSPRLVRVDTFPLTPDNHPLFVNFSNLEGTVPTLLGFGPIPLYVQAFSPVNVIVLDPNDDSIGISFNTIGNAYYNMANDSIYIEEALPGHYQIKVVKDTLDLSNDSSYAIEARIDGTADNLLASSAPVPSEGEEHNYVITSQPNLPSCLSLPGDANGDGKLNLVDIISIANYVNNTSGCQPRPDCWLWGLNCRGDWNGNGVTTLGDAISGVNYIFTRPGGPWNPVATQACCLPLF